MDPIAACERFEKEITFSGVGLHFAHKLNSIRNAVECQFDGGHPSRAVLDLLIAAMREQIRQCPAPQRSQLERCMVICTASFNVK